MQVEKKQEKTGKHKYNKKFKKNQASNEKRR
jgi:hypothetical protein